MRQHRWRHIAWLLLLVAASCGPGSATSASGLQSPSGTLAPAVSRPGDAPDAPADPADPTAPAAPAASTGFLTRQGAKLLSDGKTFRFVGLNRYDLAGGPQASKCGYAGTDAAMQQYRDSVLGAAEAMGVSVVRLWAFQNYAGPSGVDFRAFDDVVSRAKAHHIRLILTLENQWNDCSLPVAANNLSKSPDWYGGGYKQPYGYPLSFDAYVTRLVTHFKDEPTIAAWQLMNEAESSNAGALQSFAKQMAGLIKGIDAHHLVSVGTLACGQAGTDPTNYKVLHSDPNIDLLEAHDYGSPQTPMTSCMAADLLVAQQLSKPFIIGEAGIPTSSGDETVRAALLSAKMAAAGKNAVNGYTVWHLAPVKPDSDGYSFGSKGPMATAILQAAQKNFL